MATSLKIMSVPQQCFVTAYLEEKTLTRYSKEKISYSLNAFVHGVDILSVQLIVLGICVALMIY